MITQDFVKGLDLTSVTEIHGSQINQVVDVARTATDKGLVIKTQDTAEGVPDIPNPATPISGITPSWWARYIWNRLSFDGKTAYCYVWCESATSGSLLKWIRIDAAAEQALIDSAAALAAANAATSDASNASSKADAVEASQIALETEVDNLATRTTANENAITALQDIPTSFRTGDIRTTFRNETYSTTEDEGWLEASGAAVSRTIFANLFAQYGTLFGAGDGTTTFNLPDCRGRAIIGYGQGDGLTLTHTFGAKSGAETKTLAASNIPDHNHYIPIEAAGIGEYSTASGTTIGRIDADGATSKWQNISTTEYAKTVGQNNASPTSFSLMQPTIAAKVFIKT